MLNRLIPTCVGSTTLSPRLDIISSAHPHVCGEHAANDFLHSHDTGSSPRVWGAQP